MEFLRCFRCMEEADSYPCAHCGYDPGAHPGQAYVLRPGTILGGKYVAGTPLGQGGFGITYIGWDLSTERKVAIKEYFPTGQVSRNVTITNNLQWYTTNQARAALEQGMVSFQKEARKMELVSGISQVVDVFDVFEENMTAYIVMDFIDGQTLKDRLVQTGPMSWEQSKAIFLPVIEAMDKVHGKGLIHRDLSPDNLMLRPDGSVKILDLGASKDLNVNTGASSMQVAKCGFSPLEQYTQRGGSGTWTDVYAMAATIYYTLTGVLPPPAVDRVANDPLRWDLPQLTVLPANVLAALRHAMGLLQNQRTQTMAAFAKELTTPFPEKAPVKKKSRRWPIFAGAAALALVVSLVTGGDLFFSKTDTKSPTSSQTVSAVDPSSVELHDRTISQDLAQYEGSWPGNFDSDSAYADLISRCTQESYQYSDGGSLTMYFDGKDQEICRIYTDSSGQRQAISTAEYNENGQSLEYRAYDGAGQLQRLDLNEFNDEGLLTRKQIYDASGKLYRLRTWEYDSSGRDTAYGEWTGSGKATEAGLSSYDRKGIETSYSKYINGTMYAGTYDADGKPLSISNFDKNGKLTFRTEYAYDDQGRTHSTTSYYDGSQEPNSMREYVYSGDLHIQDIYHDYQDSGENITTYDWLYGPNQIEIGRQSANERVEYVRSIYSTTLLQRTQYFDSPYTSYSLSAYDWMGNSLSYVSYDLNGSLRSQSEYRYDAEGLALGHTFSSISSYDGSLSVTEYDGDNRTLTSVSYDRDGNLERRSEYTYEESQTWVKTYDANGSLIRTQQIQYNENGDPLTDITTNENGDLESMLEYQYDDDGNLTGRIRTSVSSYDGSRTITTYDGEGRELLRNTYDASGTLTSRSDYTYTDNESRQINYDGSGTMTGYTINRYSDTGVTLSVESYDGNNQLSYKDEYHYDSDWNRTGRTHTSHYSYSDTDAVTEYDADGNEISRNVYNSAGYRMEWTEYTYTDTSKTETTYGEDGSVQEVVQTLYNAAGDTLLETTYNGDGMLREESKYTYDAEGYFAGQTRTYYNLDGSKYVYEYDKDYNRISKKTYDADGNLKRSE